MRSAKLILFIVLLVHLVWRGILPALTKIDSDFPNYYVSAKLVLKGGEVDRLYDDDWFQQQIYLEGINQLGKFSPFPPVTAFVFIPLAWLKPLDALRAWTFFNIVILVASIVLLSKIVNKDWLWCSLIFLLSGHALINNFRLGQFYLVLTLVILGGYYLWQRKQHALTGLMFGFGTAIKYFPIVFLPLFVFWKEWRAVAAFLVTPLAAYFISLLVFGVKLHQQFFSSVLLGHLMGNIQNPFSHFFQSWNSLLHKLLVYEEALNPEPMLNSPALASILLGLVYCFVFFSALVALKNQQANKAKQFAFLGIAELVILPASATYHFLLLVLPVAILLSGGTWNTKEKIIATAYAGIGFIPYSFFHRFDGRGFLTVLAYPRLLLITIIFLAAASICKRSNTAVQ